MHITQKIFITGAWNVSLLNIQTACMHSLSVNEYFVPDNRNKKTCVSHLNLGEENCTNVDFLNRHLLFEVE